MSSRHRHRPVPSRRVHDDGAGGAGGALADHDLEATPLDPAQVVSGGPEVRQLGLHESDTLAIGIWQHSAGVSTDVEADEVFVVLSGRATIEVEGGPTLEVGPGDVGLLPAGIRTRWTVHATLRKVYLAL